MIIWVRNFVLIFAILSVVYLILSAHYARKQRRKLKDQHKTIKQDQPEDEFIAHGMIKYRRSLKPKLIFCVYLVPFVLMAILIYLAAYA
ncbi:hypothetical protein GCM10008927_05390 [Amylibacter ulvae]|uniref:DUF3899 domain-containing protein n=1 Tax=Paramylibacter ulvae TaxID=1651968 RepID=A0ABQ3CZ95_9RHOB|nr:hypothetical protein [Amylibacter ulvae]GHA43594.1 hypothetical protein GCM10008927_05390 [Amylibacter ulvae]